jgi:hypothetical protein
MSSRLRVTAVLAIGVVLGELAGLRVAAPSPASAQVAAHPGKAALDAKVEALKLALTEKRYGALATDIPPKLLALMAAKAGMPREEFVKLIGEQVGKAMAGSSIDAFDIKSGEILTLTTGAVYALLPSVARLTVNDQKAISRGHILAMVDGGKWYLARVSERQWPLFVEAYPDYASVEIPKEKLEFLK